MNRAIKSFLYILATLPVLAFLLLGGPNLLDSGPMGLCALFVFLAAIGILTAAAFKAIHQLDLKGIYYDED